jgi:dolichol-phosphate mannosyltransferase
MCAIHKRPLFSVVVPVYQNAASLEDLHARLDTVAADFSEVVWEFVFVDDGSTDDSSAKLQALLKRDPRILVVRLSRNFGSQAAILAGLSRARGAAVAVIAADLQDPPELLRTLLPLWLHGNKVVLAVRSRRDDPWTASLGATLFYRLFRRLALPQFPPGGFDCCLLDRQIVESLIALKGACFLPGEIVWLGFNPIYVTYDRGPRLAKYGRSMWTLGKRIRYALGALWTFSPAPLRLVQAIGWLLGVGGAAFLVRALLLSNGASGDLLVPAMTFLGGLQLLASGCLGDYVWSAQQRLRNRPVFVVDRIFEQDTAEESRHAA